MRKPLILFVFLLDAALHGILIIGWSSIREMLEYEGFFLQCEENDTGCEQGLATQKTEITKIFQLSIMLLCVIATPMNLITDNISYGLCRTISYALMALSYFLLAISTPDTLYLQYAWALHHPAAISIFTNGLSLCSLYPKYAGLLLNTSCGLISIRYELATTILTIFSSMVPQGWLAAVRAGVLTRSEIFYIWFGITILELILTTFLFPWHSVTDSDVYPNAIDVYKSAKLSLFRPQTRKASPKECFVSAVKHMKSPVFWSHILSKVVAHFSMTLSVSLANDMMKTSANVRNQEVAYNTLQSQYEVTRGVTRNG